MDIWRIFQIVAGIFAAVATAKGELKKGKGRWTLLFWVATSYVVSTITYLVLSWWWTCFIVLALGVVAFFIIRAYNKKHPVKGE